MPSEAPATVKANVAPHLESVGIPESMTDSVFQALAAAGYTLTPDGTPDPAEVVDSVSATRMRVDGIPGAFLVTVTDGDVELRWMEWHGKDGSISRSNVSQSQNG